MVRTTRADHPSEAQAIRAVALVLGITSVESLRQWTRQAEVDDGVRTGTSRHDAAELKRAKRDTAEAVRAAAIRSSVRTLLPPGTPRPTTATLVQFITEHAGRRTGNARTWGVEPICAALAEHGASIAPSTYYAARAAPPTVRRLRDELLTSHIAGVQADSEVTLGSRKVWLELKGQGIKVARCTVERLMRDASTRATEQARRAS